MWKLRKSHRNILLKFIQNIGVRYGGNFVKNILRCLLWNVRHLDSVWQTNKYNVMPSLVHNY